MSRMDEFRARVEGIVDDARVAAGRVDWGEPRVRRIAILGGALLLTLVVVLGWAVFAGGSGPRRSAPSGRLPPAALRESMIELDRRLRMTEGLGKVRAATERRGGWRVVLTGEVPSDDALNRLDELVVSLLPDAKVEREVVIVEPPEPVRPAPRRR